MAAEVLHPWGALEVEATKEDEALRALGVPEVEKAGAWAVVSDSAVVVRVAARRDLNAEDSNDHLVGRGRMHAHRVCSRCVYQACKEHLAASIPGCRCGASGRGGSSCHPESAGGIDDYRPSGLSLCLDPSLCLYPDPGLCLCLYPCHFYLCPGRGRGRGRGACRCSEG